MSIVVRWVEYDIYGNDYPKEIWYTDVEEAGAWLEVLREHEKVGMVSYIEIGNVPDS